MAIAFFSNFSGRIPKYGNFGSKFKNYFFILLRLHELLIIFNKKEVVILTT